MLRTPAPLIGALYVGGLKASDGWLPAWLESLDVPQSSAACSRVFSRRDTPSGLMGLQSKSSAALLVSKHAKACEAKLLRVGGEAPLIATSILWRTPREFCHRDSLPVPDMLATQLFCAKPFSERTRPKITRMQTPRTPYNKLVEGTPPCCALRRPSPARYTSAG